MSNTGTNDKKTGEQWSRLVQPIIYFIAIVAIVVYALYHTISMGTDVIETLTSQEWREFIKDHVISFTALISLSIMSVAAIAISCIIALARIMDR
ncbi:MAG TPA: hypothetical protein PKE26_12430 [Kiritimatiellia bacterium]|nr:hypothetical protein [Kiritimatiellia bacterium]HMO99907.1 hypothetical protein [Kiritimatiellia bacterium]HMP96048.1 hypothetical protein [Kiritimatiellia bacterium]